MKEIIYIISAGLTIFMFVTGIQKVSDLLKPSQTAEKGNGGNAQGQYTYGPGNGKLLVYKVCNGCQDITVAIDGFYIGTLTTSFAETSAAPGEGVNGTISRVLPVGDHVLTAKDVNGTMWNATVSIREGQCTTNKIFKPDDKPINPFGNGNGKVTVYKTCENCPDLQVSIDGSYIGSLAQPMGAYATVSCDATGTVSQILSAGNHQLTGKDSYGNTWDLQISVIEGQCSLQKLEKQNDVPPAASGGTSVATNPYGNGNGQLTIYENCSTCQNVQVYIDGVYAGVLNAYFRTDQTPTCGLVTAGSIVRTLPAGNHKISATDSNGDSWNDNVYVEESVCKDYAMQGFLQHSVSASGTINTYGGQRPGVYVSPGVQQVPPPPVYRTFSPQPRPLINPYKGSGRGHGNR